MTLRELARALGCELRGDGDVEITGVAALEDATPGTVTFLADRRYAGRLAGTRAAAVIVGRDAPALDRPTLIAPHPYVAFADAIALFHPRPRPAPGVHPTAVVAPTAVVGAGAAIGPWAVVGERARLGANAVLGPHVVVEHDAVVGDDFVAGPGVVVRDGVRIGDRVLLHPGVVVGSDGFGFVPLPGGHKKIPQVGTVVVEDDVEIGANSTIDRAQLGATVIGRGSKIDNLVQVAHGCRIGPGCLVAAQTGLAGSTVVGAGAMLGGQTGSAGHLTIGAGAQIAAKSGLHHDVPPGALHGGYPAIEVRQWRRASAVFARLPELSRRLRAVERRLGLVGPLEDE